MVSKIKNILRPLKREVLALTGVSSDYRNLISGEDIAVFDGLTEELLSNGTFEAPKEVEEVAKYFSGKYLKSDHRILIHTPPLAVSPGGYSVFSNMCESLNFMGVPTYLLAWNENTTEVFEKFSPTVLITSDHPSYTDLLDWNYIKDYKLKKNFAVGLSASIEAYGNSPLVPRLDWAKRVDVDFYYSFRAEEYVQSRLDYKPFGEYGYQICSIEFGANIMKFFPVEASGEKALDYIFFGSTNYDKADRYSKFLRPIAKNYNGMVQGPGWPWVKKEIPFDLQKVFYSKAKIGLNLHLREQIEWQCELNERTYILAACKIPQLLDNPALLPQRFATGSFFSAATPAEYKDLFQYILENELETSEKTQKMYEAVLRRHTTFHRMETFIQFLDSIEK